MTANQSAQALLPAIAPVVHQAHAQGTSVLMCGLNNHDAAGWAEFQTDADARQFAGQCATVLTQYASYTYNGTAPFSNLSWGWTMSYWGTPQQQMQPYCGLMVSDRLVCGFWDQQSNPTQDGITWLADNGYAGVMVYALSDGGSPALLNMLLAYWSNATGSWP